jgi:hypothetical protein
MRGADMLDVALVQVRLHREALLPENRMIPRAGQWCQAISSGLLNDRDVGRTVSGVSDEEAEDALQASSIPRYSVILSHNVLTWIIRPSGIPLS